MRKKFVATCLLLGLVFSSLLILPRETFAGSKRRTAGSAKSRKISKNRQVRQRARVMRASSSRRFKQARAPRKRATQRSFVSRVQMPPERVVEIQAALQREGYFNSEPSGQYDKATVDAMTNYQRNNSFRATGYPTAESLQKLGLTRQRRVNPPPTTDENKEVVPPAGTSEQ